MRIEDHPSPTDVAYLADRIYEFNVAATGYDDGRELAVLERDTAGRIVAGIYGWTWGGLAEIDKLWVDEPLRGDGKGVELIAAFETEARKRACARVLVGTHSFQAPGFYQRLGYSIVAAVADKPPGYSHYDLVKSL